MANSEHLAKLKEGVKAWNKWRTAHPEIKPDLKEADLEEVVLGWVNLARGNANLSEANLSGVNFRGAGLWGVNLSGADLSESILDWANLTGAQLNGANLRGAHLLGANLHKANLNEANLEKATMRWTTFGASDLSGANGLDTINHHGPSTIGIDTIYSSRGKIPLAFLRGAGIPENLIEYIPFLTSQGAIQFYSCFISYSTKDQEFADRLYADLQSIGGALLVCSA